VRVDPEHAAASDRVNVGRPGQWLTSVGLLTETWTKPTRRGSVWGGGRIEDRAGLFQVFAFGETAALLADGLLVQAKGVTDRRDEQPALKITELKVLER